MATSCSETCSEKLKTQNTPSAIICYHVSSQRLYDPHVHVNFYYYFYYLTKDKAFCSFIVGQID